MHHLTSWILLVIGSLYIASVSGSPASAMGEPGDQQPLLTSSVEMVEGKPDRPRLFQSPEQIRSYLDTLGKYYSYHNRNRFGKRTALYPFNRQQSAYERPKAFQEYEIQNIN